MSCMSTSTDPRLPLKSRSVAIIPAGVIFGLLCLTPAASSAAADSHNDYQSGSAVLRVFKADSADAVSDQEPVFKMRWTRDLACVPPDSGGNIWLVAPDCPDAFLAPERAYGLGVRPGGVYSFPYVARFSFYYEAKAPGRHTFEVWHGHNTVKLIVADSLIADMQPDESQRKGICVLEKGFFPAELWIISNIYGGAAKNDPYFRVDVSAPGAAAAVPVTRGMLFVKTEKKKSRAAD